MYEITRDYIRMGNSRSGQKISRVRFIVSHDTGNPGSTAYNNQTYFNNQQPSASAHTFIDDKYILEIIPLNEKAWHVQYNKPKDNQLFGADANDAAIGVELCWGGSINFQEAYKRYVWYHAYLCKTFNLQPRQHIVSHKTLDPQRRSDPDNALKRYGITWSQFINDVQKEFNNQNVANTMVKRSVETITTPPEDEWKFVKVVSTEYGIYSEPSTKWQETSDKFLNWIFVARKRQVVEGQLWYELYLGDRSYGWIAAHQVEILPYKWGVTNEDTVSYTHANLNSVHGTIAKGSRIVILEEQEDKYLVIAANVPQWVPKNIVPM